MSKVILFHHALGLTDGVIRFAEKLRDARHEVYTPDLFEGRVFKSIGSGLEYVKEVGFEKIIERGITAAQEHPLDLVYAGFSLGVLPAQKLAQTRKDARGALLFYSCAPVSFFSPRWPDGVPVQIHAMDSDPIFVGEGDLDAARALVENAQNAELFLYQGSEHYFADSTLPSYCPDAATLLIQRVLQFLTTR
jgi:dienelactone hydrolase